MVVRGSCSCYGHANRCLPLPGIDPKPDMVHGRCECTHNTKGRNCEKCEDFFNDLPWSPAVGQQSNACKRCNCNKHATSCHFDSAVYEASGRVSGGVCDGCKHNTMGINCEQCKSFYYRDPAIDIQDPDVCKPCDCDPHGSLDSGICDSITDKANNLIAGSCHCKQNVEGRRCDTCKNGYWNFDANNPLGCEPCTCNTLGTIDNRGCNVLDGECTCKRYVIGRDCNQCLPEYWGLSEHRDGCHACDCDPGASFDNNCDVVTGQCKCRDHITGRTCNGPKQQHFTARLDFLLYEAELARGSPTCQVVIREPYRDGQEDTWTGTGFMKSYEGSFIEFTVGDIKTTAEYDPVIRYELMQNNDWDQITFTLIRPDNIDPASPCASREDDDIKTVTLPARDRSVIVSPPLCLDAGKTYKVKLDFRRSQYDRDTPSASVLIDSIVLYPRIESIPWFKGSPPAEARRREFEQYCSPSIYKKNPRQIPEICKKHLNSIGVYIFKGAYLCQCDPTGSVSKLCSEYGGECTCKPNVVGRRCDRCAAGTYGFGPEGCKACDCNSIGALDNFCNATTGQCKCRANTYGRECDQCRTGFWNFPNCQRCDCNGHADICDSRTGACINCREYTQGHTCDHCVEGYYGDPRLNVDIPCRQCPCPGTPDLNHSFAKRCALDPSTRDVICECQDGYSGSRCDVCADNYYGNPEVPGGECKPCECNKKIDLLRPGNCDPRTGKCKQCLYETTGDHCEICSPGYFRNSEEEMCRPCACDILGTNHTAGPCQHDSGKCPCNLNVVGDKCDKCVTNHWKIASGEGCEACNCDPVGSTSLQCNEYDGQCECRDNFGGRQCDQCKSDYWGNPKANQCYKCQCNPDGSKTSQCDRKTGACECRPGIGGHKCDVCDRGYLGQAPECSPCGECFDNWDRILEEHQNSTYIEINKAKDIKKVGATGAYTKEFDEIQEKLVEIDNLLNKTATVNLDSIDENLDALRKLINDIVTEENNLKELDDKLNNIGRENKLAEVNLKTLRNEVDKLQNKTDELKKNATHLQEADVKGALDIIREANVTASKAVEKAQKTQADIKYAALQCKATENLINVTRKDFEENQMSDRNSLDLIRNNLDNINDELKELNTKVCGGTGYPCDKICGGALCGHCGDSVTCGNSYKVKAEGAYKLAQGTENVLKLKEAEANNFKRNISLVNVTLSMTLAQEAYDKAYDAYKSANNTRGDVNKAKESIEKFLKQNTTTLEDLEKLGEKVFAQDIKLTPDEIRELAEKIKSTVHLLTNIDPIIEDTKEDLEKAKKLKTDAEEAKKQAETIKSTADQVQKDLNSSKDVQQKADKAITEVNRSFEDMKDRLNKISNITDVTNVQIKDTSQKLGKLKDELVELNKLLSENRNTAKELDDESKRIKDRSKNISSNLETLNNKYGATLQDLNVSLKNVENYKEKTEDLQYRAATLAAAVKRVRDDLLRLDGSSSDSQLSPLEQDIKNLTDRMDEYINYIDEKHNHYKICSP